MDKKNLFYFMLNLNFIYKNGESKDQTYELWPLGRMC